MHSRLALLWSRAWSQGRTHRCQGKARRLPRVLCSRNYAVEIIDILDVDSVMASLSYRTSGLASDNLLPGFVQRRRDNMLIPQSYVPGGWTDWH